MFYRQNFVLDYIDGILLQFLIDKKISNRCVLQVGHYPPIT